MPETPPSDEPETEIDIPKLLDGIRRGAEIGRLTAQLRPSRQVLGKTLKHTIGVYRTTISIERSATEIADMIDYAAACAAAGVEPEDPDERYAWEPWLPAEAARARDDLEALTALGWPTDFLQRDSDRDFGRPIFLVRRLMESGLDHLNSIAILMKTKAETRSPFALARIALEAFARAWYILDPDIDAEQRLFRTINIELEAIDKEIHAAAKSGDTDAAKEAGREKKQLLDIAKAHNAVRSPKNGQRIDPWMSASEMVDQLLDRSGGSTYHDLSRIVHAQEDEGFRLAFGFADSQGNPHHGMYIAMHVLPAVVALMQVGERLGAYLDWTMPAEADDAIQSVLLVWSHGAGLADDYYRQLAERQIGDENDV